MSSRRLTQFHPLLFAAYAVLFLYAENVDITGLSEVWPSLLVAVGGAAALLLLANAAMRDGGRAAVLSTVVVLLFFFAYTPVKAAVDGVTNPSPELEGLLRGGLLGAQFLLLSAAAILLTVALLRRIPTRVAALNSALTVGAVVLLAFPLVTLATFAAGTRLVYSPGPSELVAQRKPTRDIYYLILDRYGTNSGLETAFGVTGNDLPDWLAQHGFYVAPAARANYDRTGLSIPATLSLDYLDDVVAAMGPDSTDYQTVFEMIQDHKVGRFLKEQGYEYVHLGNWFGPMSHIRIADRNLRPGAVNEFEATMYDETALPALGALFTLQAPIPVIELLQYDSARYQFATLSELADRPGPKFVFTHVLLPHDPYVFEPDGTFYFSAERGTASEDDRFQAQLEYLNGQVKQLVEHLLARPESERPIIVIQADEGPQPLRFREQRLDFDWTTATDEEIRAKFAILGAFYLPPEANEPAGLPEPYPTISSVNTFRLLFDRYFGTGLGLLPDHSYVARVAGRPFDQIEITDRLGP